MQTETDGMRRMSLMQHLEELRSRVLRALYGFGAVFVICLIESEKLFNIAMAPGWQRCAALRFRERILSPLA